jgi:hypothetical protein
MIDLWANARGLCVGCTLLNLKSIFKIRTFKTMTQMALYFNLLFDIETSDHRLTWLDQYPKHEEEFIAEKNANRSLKEELAAILNSLLEDNNDADKIRLGYIHITKGFLNAFSKIDKWGGYYPDLSQGMIVHGYLFGLILNDYRTNLISEGNYYPVAQIYMSEKEWPAVDLKKLLEQINQDLVHIQFRCKMDAITFFNRIRHSFHTKIHILQELRII